ncbi:MAG: tRNA pseudouridine(55) synthase TruB [Bacteroidales bacterium]|nr:tRNA pseudouridine(55) synthase TruB [Bacteroidales bacterium]
MEYNRPETYLDGAVLYIDKPLTWTSFDVVNKIRKSLRHHLGIQKIKVGHAGTLDPLATGLVIICTGKATKQIMQYQDMDKAYTAQVRLGATTPSFDLETEVDKTYPWEHITSDKIEQALSKLSGDQEQMPPLYSAKSVDGKRAYAMARKGKQVELKPQQVHISHLELLSENLPEIELRVECSKGTYIRSLARDLGSILDSGAHLTGLRRTRIGPYHVDKAISIENFIENLKLL